MSQTAVQGEAPRLQRLYYLRDLLRELVVRDMKLRYKRAFLGLLWSLLNPLAQLAVSTVIFSVVLPLNIENYPAFLFTGLLAWGWFQSALAAATGSIVQGRHLIRRPSFPLAILPVVTVTTDLIHFLLALPILLAFLMLLGIYPSWSLLLLPAVIAVQFTFTLSLSYFLSAIHVVFRDTQYLVGLALLLLFYLTPIFYNASSIPARVRPIYFLNPLLHLMEAYRAIFLEGAMPSPVPLLLIMLGSLGLLALGYRYFIAASYRFVEEV